MSPSYSYEMLAAHSAIKAAMLQLLAAYAKDGKYLSAVQAQVEIEDHEAVGSFAVGGLARDEFHQFAGGSL